MPNSVLVHPGMIKNRWSQLIRLRPERLALHPVGASRHAALLTCNMLAPPGAGEPWGLLPPTAAARQPLDLQAYRAAKCRQGGGNAPKFALLFTLAIASPLMAVLLPPWLGGGALFVGILLLVVLVAGPAILSSLNRGTFRHFPSLCALYMACGLARMIDLLRSSPGKLSWKSRAGH